MSTNFYLKHKCHCCGNEQEIHLGKRSGGWKFALAYDEDNYTSWNEMKEWIRKHEWEIYDEYDDYCDKEHFIAIVEDWQDGKSHSSNYTITDNDGYEFITREFS